jgi:antitoxin MazE
MESKIVAIGNSQGVRLPKHMLDACHLSLNQPIKIDVDGGRLVISPAKKPREGWELMLDGAENEPDLLAGIPLNEALDD